MPQLIKLVFHKLCLTAVFLGGLHSNAFAQTFELSLDQGRVAARQAALSGNFALARDLALALVDADTQDRSALIVLAAVQPQLGDAREGRRAGAQAFRLSNSIEERYEAARLTALAAANEERYTLSQVWLRRAAINAPDERSLLQTQSDYRGIRNLNPWTINLGFSVRPSNNVNGGSDTEYNIIDGLPFVGVLSDDALALSGIAATGDLRLSYGLTRTAERQTNLTARAYTRAVWLSDAAREVSPASSNSDFGSQVLEFGVNHKRRVGDGVLSAEALVGWSWFGGDLSSQYNRASLSYNTMLGERLSGIVSGQVQEANIMGAFERANMRRSVSFGLNYRTQGNNRLSGQLAYEAQSSDNLNERYETITAQFGYAWSDPIGPMQLSVIGGIAHSDYRDYTIILPVPGGRQDTRVFGSINAVFHTLDYAGFVPVVTLGIQDTESNVSRFTRDEYSLSIGIRSSF